LTNGKIIEAEDVDLAPVDSPKNPDNAPDILYDKKKKIKEFGALWNSFSKETQAELFAVWEYDKGKEIYEEYQANKHFVAKIKEGPLEAVIQLARVYSSTQLVLAFFQLFRPKLPLPYRIKNYVKYFVRQSMLLFQNDKRKFLKDCARYSAYSKW